MTYLTAVFARALNALDGLIDALDPTPDPDPDPHGLCTSILPEDS